MRSLCLAVVAALAPVTLAAQMSVAGRVTVADRPVDGVSVGIPALGIEVRTNASGSYNFLIRATQVRGQTVQLVARHRRFGNQAVSIVLAGGSIEQNFTLQSGQRPADSAVARARNAPNVPTTPAATGREPRIIALAQPLSRMVDSSAFTDVSGPTDVAGALAGRIPGLVVTSASVPGGSSLMVYRGARSLSGSIQPLVVVDGVPLDNSSIPSSATQQFGLGGFDYGSSLQDLFLDDIATVVLLNSAEAVPLYGSRAANGVLLITTKAPGAKGFVTSVRVRHSRQSASRLPVFQNRFGQGLGGQFEFFDGQGGGINDGVDQSWGPALDGQPIAQASMDESRRPDVRHWLSRPNGMRDYFDGGSDLSANAVIQAARGASRGRLSLSANDVKGVMPGSEARRLGVALNGVSRPTDRFTAAANVQVVSRNAERRPGTGFDDINPVAGFTRMGRQVDLDALRTNRMALDSSRVNWIYDGRNNPFFQLLDNSNKDESAHIIGGTRLTLALSHSLNAEAHVGVDNVEESRSFRVEQGWVGGYPTAIGRADFRGGGAQKQDLSASDLLAGVSLNLASRVAALDATATAGVEVRQSRFENNTTVTTGAFEGFPGTSTEDNQSVTHNVNALYLVGRLASGSGLSLQAGTRVETSASFADDLGPAIFPSVTASYDAAQAHRSIRNLGLGAARLRASWWRAGSEVTGRTLSRAFTGGGTATSPTVGVAIQAVVPERTEGFELGTELATPGSRLAVDITGYRERSTDVLVGAFAVQSASLSNSGVEMQVRAVPYVGVLGGRWDVIASVGTNKGTVDAIGGGALEAPLGPPILGAALVARRGEPIGAIVGSRFMRNPDGLLILRNGLPIPDGTMSVLGSWQPDWTMGLENRIRWGGLEVGLLLDARVGGEIFSATNRWGSYSGTLESTLAGREGMTVSGIDSVTGSPFTGEVTAEDYYHALGGITEAWVMDASYVKLREARLTYELPLSFFPGLRSQVARLTVAGRNLWISAKAPNIDPETVLSSTTFQGFEMGQLPGTRSLGFVLSVTP